MMDILRPFKIALAICAGPALVMAWVATYAMGCWALVWIAAIALVVFSHVWAANSLRARRISDLYFKRGTLLNGIMFSRIRLFLTGLFSTLVLVAVLAFTAAGWDEGVIALLAGNALLVFMLLVAFRALARGPLGATDVFAPLVARQFAVRLNTVILTVALTWLALNAPPPEYVIGQPSLRAAMDAAALGPLEGAFSRCAWIDTLVSWGRQVDALKWWSMGQATGQISSTDLRFGAWILFLLSGGISALGYSILCVQLGHLALGWPNAGAGAGQGGGARARSDDPWVRPGEDADGPDGGDVGERG